MFFHEKTATIFYFYSKNSWSPVAYRRTVLGYKNYTALKKVYSYEETIAEQTEKYGISDYQELAMSIMLTESKGEGNDPMQSSESAYGKQNQFENAQDSIEQGVAYLAKLIKNLLT